MKILFCIMIGFFFITPLITNFHTSIQIHSVNQPNDLGESRVTASALTEILTKDFPRLRINGFGFTKVTRVRDILGFTKISRVRNTFRYMFCLPPPAWHFQLVELTGVSHDPPALPKTLVQNWYLPPPVALSPINAAQYPKMTVMASFVANGH